MIIGIGTDITKIERIKKAIESTEAFLEKSFTDDEISLFAEKNMKPARIALNFAAKEAFSKALGTGVRGFALKDVEVLRDNLGKPYINTYNEAKKICDDMKVVNIHVSLSDTKDDALAFVILER